MNIAILMRGQSGAPGGSGVPGGQIVMAQLARALTQLGENVQLFVGGPRMSYLEGIESVASTYFGWPEWLDRLIAMGPGQVRAFGKNLRQRYWLNAVAAIPGIASADIIHVQGIHDAESLLRRFSGPIVVTQHGRLGRWRISDASATSQDAMNRRTRRIRENVKMVAVGIAQGAELQSVGMPADDVIPPGIDTRIFTGGSRAEARHRLHLIPDRGYVLYVGRLTPDKNVETLLQAFANRLPTSRPAGLLILGDGPLKPDLQRMCSALGIDAAATFLPSVPQSELPIYYHSADVTVVPSNYLETFCMVALEAIACGCPLIVTDQVPEIVRRFPEVSWVKACDVDALTGKIDAALDGLLLPARVDSNILFEFDWIHIAQRYMSLYRKALRGSTLDRSQ